MTTQTMKIGIVSYEAFMSRTMAIARGEPTPAPDDPKVWCPSPEGFAKVLSRNKGP
jgi:predicted transcriptional regulator